MEERCDHFPNCEDHSDEEDCHVVLPPYDYHAFYAPFRYTYDGHKLIKVPVKIKVIYCGYLYLPCTSFSFLALSPPISYFSKFLLFSHHINFLSTHPSLISPLPSTSSPPPSTSLPSPLMSILLLLLLLLLPLFLSSSFHFSSSSSPYLSPPPSTSPPPPSFFSHLFLFPLFHLP